jgi:hypothetical protein
MFASRARGRSQDAGSRSATTDSTVRDETANDSDDSATDGIQGDHADQQECQDHKGSATFTGALSACDRNRGNADQERTGEEHSAGLGEPKSVTEPPPIASESRHARSLGQRDERTLARVCGNVAWASSPPHGAPSFRLGNRPDGEPSGTGAEPMPGRPGRPRFVPGTGCVPPASRLDRAGGRARAGRR